MGKYRKHALTALKILVSVALIYFIFTKLDIAEVTAVLKKAQPLYLLLAVLFFILSKVFASFRLNVYFHLLGVPLTQKSNLKLYWLGMFYNLFLPGGIGGDAYKGYVIHKKFSIVTKRLVSVLVLDRLSGLLLIFLFSCLFAILLNTSFLTDYRIVIAILAVVSILIFWLLNKRLLPYLLPAFWKSFGYSFLVQGVQILSVIFILKALSINLHTTAYLFIFMVSSIISVLPFTIGGIGSLELGFYYGANMLELNENTAVGISILFFLIKAVVSLLGMLYHFKKPELETLEEVL